MYEIFEHTADLGLRIEAATRDELFVEAAQALYAVLLVDPSIIESNTPMEFVVTGTRDDHLLLDWLSELLFRFDTEGLLLGELELILNAEGLRARARGESFDPLRHERLHEVKAVTYHGLRVQQDEKGWSAELVLDI